MLRPCDAIKRSFDPIVAPFFFRSAGQPHLSASPGIFTFGNAQFHVPNNTDRTVSPNNHAMTQTEGCFQIAPLPTNNLAAIRQAEQQQSLNTG